MSVPSSETTDEKPLDTTDPKVLKARLIIRGLGGAGNIKEVDSCFSWLRVTIEDMSKVDEQILKSTGCNGAIKPDNHNIQVIYGTTMGLIKKDTKEALSELLLSFL